VQTINVGYQDRWRHHKEQEVPEQEVRAPKREFDDLHHEFTSRLRHDVRTKATAVPPTCPPCAVRLVVLELPSQEHGNKDLVNGTLNSNDRNESKNRV
jgi:hypothetical protein